MEPHPSSRWIVVPAGLLGALAIGALGFALTRDRAIDAGATPPPDGVPSLPAPESRRCLAGDGSRLRHAGSGRLVLRDRSATLDARPVTLASLPARCAAASRQRCLVALGDLGLFARPGLSLSIVSEWLRALRRLEVTRLRAIVRTIHAQETATLGPLPIAHYCGHEVRMSDRGAPLSRFRSWGALARTAEEAGGISIAVPLEP